MQRGFAHIGILITFIIAPLLIIGAVLLYNTNPPLLQFPGAQQLDPNIILYENWDTTYLANNKSQKSQLYNEFDQAPNGEEKVWTRSLSIDGCFAQSKITNGTCQTKDPSKDQNLYGPLLNSDGAGIDIIDYEGRKVNRYWLKQNTWSSHGARLNLKYDFLRPYANSRIYARYYMMFPEVLPVVSTQGDGLWTSIGVEMKAHGWNTNATIQHNYNQTGDVWMASPHINVTSQPLKVQANHWYKMDVIWDMYPDGRGKWEAFVDDIKLGEGTGKMADNGGYGLWIFNLYGNMFRNQVRGEMYIGDVILSKAPITDTITTAPTPTPLPTPTPVPLNEQSIPQPVATTSPNIPSSQLLRWHSSLNSRDAVLSPTVGLGGTVNGASFTGGYIGNALQCNAMFENVSFSSTGMNKSAGRVEFWVKPDFDQNDRVQHNFFVDNVGAFALVKSQYNALDFMIDQGGGNFISETVYPNNYSLPRGEWSQLAVEWNEFAPLSDQLKIYINGIQPPHVDNASSYQGARIPLGNELVICDSGPRNTSAVIDEFKLYSGVSQISPTPVPTPVAIATPTASPTPSPTPTPSIPGPFTSLPKNSFRGIYYNNKDYTDQKFIRTDNDINFDWRWGSPSVTNIANDTFSVRWDGEWEFKESGTYVFSVYTDDGMVVIIDDKVIFNTWKDQHARHTFTHYLERGWHLIRVGYYENGGFSVAKLNWKLQ